MATKTTEPEVFTSTIIFDSKGNVDEDLTRLAFEEFLTSQSAEVSTRNVAIREAVETIFGRYPDQYLESDPFLVLVTNQMGIGPFEKKVWSKHIMAYIHNNTSEYVVKRGANGGCRRISDIKENEKSKK